MIVDIADNGKQSSAMYICANDHLVYLISITTTTTTDIFGNIFNPSDRQHTFPPFPFITYPNYLDSFPFLKYKLNYNN